jgi:hypothetical protein
MTNGEDEEISSDELLTVAVFGKQVEIFWDGELGGYLKMRIAAEREEAMKNLARADRNNAQEVGRWQDRIAMVDLIQDWITDLIKDGLQAARALEEN